MTITLLPKEIAEFLQANVLGCHLVGVSNENEVFVEFDHEDPTMEKDAAVALRAQFPEITQVTVVIRPSITQLKEMIDALNQAVGESTPPKKPLLDIGSF